VVFKRLKNACADTPYLFDNLDHPIRMALNKIQGSPGLWSVSICV